MRDDEDKASRSAGVAKMGEHTRIVLDSLFEGLVELDGKNRIVFVNKTALDILKRGEEELLDRDFFEAVAL